MCNPAWVGRYRRKSADYTGSVAIGNNAQITPPTQTDTTIGAIAIGNNSVSAGGRQITDVAPDTYGTNAVNVNQLLGVSQNTRHAASSHGREIIIWLGIPKSWMDWPAN